MSMMARFSAPCTLFLSTGAQEIGWTWRGAKSLRSAIFGILYTRDHAVNLGALGRPMGWLLPDFEDPSAALRRATPAFS